MHCVKARISMSEDGALIKIEGSVEPEQPIIRDYIFSDPVNIVFLWSELQATP